MPDKTLAKNPRWRLFFLCSVLLVLVFSKSVFTAPIIINPGDVLNISFSFDSPHTSTPDLLQFGFNTDYTGLHTHKLYNDNTLLGTFNGDSGGSITGWFKSSESTFNLGTVVDFNSILDRTIQGRIEFSVISGPVQFDPLAPITGSPLGGARIAVFDCPSPFTGHCPPAGPDATITSVLLNGVELLPSEDSPPVLLGPSNGNYLVLWEPGQSTTDPYIIQNRPSVVLTHGWQKVGQYIALPEPCTALPCPEESPVPPLNTIWTGSRNGQAMKLIADAYIKDPDKSINDINIFQFVWKSAFTKTLPIWIHTADEYRSAHQDWSAAGAELAKLLHGVLEDDYEQPIHFIGHSLGTAVNASALFYFLQKTPKVSSAQFTALDRPDTLHGVSVFDDNIEPVLFDDDFYWAWLRDTYLRINLKIDNYFSTNFLAFGDIAEPQDVIYNHIPPDGHNHVQPHGLVSPGDIPVDFILGSPTDESIHHSGVHEWYRWTMSPTAPSGVGCVINFIFHSIDLDPSLDTTLSPCESGWQWAITNPKPLLFPVTRIPPNLIFSFEAASLALVQNQGCSITFGGILTTTILCIEQSSPFIIAEIDIPANAKYLSFDYLFSNIGDGDYAAVFLDETPIWKFMGTSFVGNEFINSGPIPIGQLEGTHELLIALYGVGELNAEFSVQNISFITPVPVTLVNIDIKPGSDTNCLNMNGHGVIPVAINGSATFDAQLVDPATLVFNGLAVKVQEKKQKLACSLSDWNNDGFIDMVCKF